MAKRWKWIRTILAKAGHYTSFESLKNVKILKIDNEKKLHWKDGDNLYKAGINDNNRTSKHTGKTT